MITENVYTKLFNANCTRHSFEEIAKAMEENKCVSSMYLEKIDEAGTLLFIWEEPFEEQKYPGLYAAYLEAARYFHGEKPFELGRLEKGGERFPLELWQEQRQKMMELNERLIIEINRVKEGM